MKTMQVYGFRKIPREVALGMIADCLHLSFEEQDSLTLGAYATAQHGVEIFRLLNNYNVLENQWLEDNAREYGVLLYVDGIGDARRAGEIRQVLMERFPTVAPLSAVVHA